jgi:hypothetical protein
VKRLDPLTLLRLQLQDTIGAYCSFCEVPVNVSQAVMSKRVRQLKRVPPLSDWSNLLLACDYCQVHRTADAADLSRYLWPDTDATFSLGSASPFLYALKDVTYIVTTDTPPDSGPALPGSTKQMAIVSANPSSPSVTQAQNTIDLFQLNTPFYNASTNTFTISESALQARIDPRVDLRTQAWTVAASAIATLREAKGMASTAPAYYDGAVKLTAALAQANGFWSSWMTTIWQAFGDSALIRAVLLDTDTRRGYQVLGNQTVPDGGRPPWTIFTGTAVKRL